MDPISDFSGKYFNDMAKRGKESRAYTEHQFIGLQVADILDDRAHKALYIKLAKKFGKDKMLIAAKGVAEKKDVKNKGAYFMRVIYGNGTTQINKRT